MTFRFLRPGAAAALALVALGALPACSLDVANPNSADEERVLTSREGLLAAAIGMQQYYAASVLNTATLTPGVTSGEAAVVSTFLNLIELQQGAGALNGTNGNVVALWSRPFRVIAAADQILASTGSVTMSPGTKSGLEAVARLYKAMSLGILAQNFEQAPISSGQTPTFVPRAQVFAEAIRLLAAAETQLVATAPSPEFTTTGLVPGIDLLNTVRAYKARYLLFSGQNQPAADAAATVSASAKSEFRYDAQTSNPVYASSVATRDYAPRDNLGLAAVQAGDQRLEFYVDVIAGTSVTPFNLPVDRFDGFWKAATTPIPAYLPDEMRLIRAEAFARLDRLPEAVAELNAVRTQAPAADPFGVGGGLPAFASTSKPAILDAIYYERAVELYLQGMRLEDNRRFGYAAPETPGATRTRTFYPYPNAERDNNPNTPPDPAI